jgi:hypothetical protein
MSEVVAAVQEKVASNVYQLSISARMAVSSTAGTS